jgi:hypothetical protein
MFTFLFEGETYSKAMFYYNNYQDKALIQVDISGHPPIPLTQKTVFHLGSFSTVFRVPNCWGRFEALNDVFWGFGAQENARDTDSG